MLPALIVDFALRFLGLFPMCDTNTLVRPKDPLKVLGEYLLQRSKDLEGT